MYVLSVPERQMACLGLVWMSIFVAAAYYQFIWGGKNNTLLLALESTSNEMRGNITLMGKMLSKTVNGPLKSCGEVSVLYSREAILFPLLELLIPFSITNS